MKYLLLFSLIFYSSFQFCVAQENVTRHYFQFEIGDTVYLFGDQVNLREAPDVNSKVIAQLKIGHRMNVIGVASSTHFVNGLGAPWYHVRFENTNQQQDGYVWGGLLAQYGLSGEDGMAFYYGLTKIKDGELTAEMRAVKGQNIISKVSFQPVGSMEHYTYGWISNGRGIPVIKNLFGVHACFDACDYECGEVLLAWSGQELHYIGYSSGNGGGGSYSESYFLFPEDKGGQAGHIVSVFTESEFDEIGNGTEVITKKIFEWNGNKLVHVKSDY